MLTWQNNVPRFVINGVAGNELTLFFGKTPDLMTIFYYGFVLEEQAGNWLIRESLTYGMDRQWRPPEPDVAGFASEIVSAIKFHREFDFHTFFAHCEKDDPSFSAMVTNRATQKCGRYSDQKGKAQNYI